MKNAVLRMLFISICMLSNPLFCSSEPAQYATEKKFEAQFLANFSSMLFRQLKYKYAQLSDILNQCTLLVQEEREVESEEGRTVDVRTAGEYYAAAQELKAQIEYIKDDLRMFGRIKTAIAQGQPLSLEQEQKLAEFKRIYSLERQEEPLSS